MRDATPQDILEVMLGELGAHQLTVVLVPSKRSDRREWDMIRVAVDKNPRWYSKLCADNPSSRGMRRGKMDTRIRRRNVLRALERMLVNKYRGKYLADFQRIARGRCA